MGKSQCRKCGHNMRYPGRISSLVKFQAVILVNLGCVYPTRVSQRRRLPSGHLPVQLAIIIQSLSDINDAIEKGRGQTSTSPTEVTASCLFIVSEVLNHHPRDPQCCWFPFEQIRLGLFSAWLERQI